MVSRYKLIARNHESEAIGLATDRWHSRKNRGHHGTPPGDRGGHRDVTIQIIQQNQGIVGDTRMGNFSRHDRLLIPRNGGRVLLGIRTLAWEGIQDASGVRENAAGRRNERRSRSTPRTIRDSGRAKGWSPAAFERGRGSDPRWGAARDPMEFPKGKRDRRANGRRHGTKLAPVAESGAADAADREPVGRRDRCRDFSVRRRSRSDAESGTRSGRRR